MMRATTLDLRYRTKEILRAVERGEIVTILYRGKPKAKIVPITAGRNTGRLRSDEAFGLWKNRKDLSDVRGWVGRLRRGRLVDL